MNVGVKKLKVPKNHEIPKIPISDVVGQFSFPKEIPKNPENLLITCQLDSFEMEPRVQYLKVPKTTKIPKIPFYNVSEQFTF